MAETLTLQPSKSCVISEIPGEIDKNLHPATVQSTTDYSRYALFAYDIAAKYWYLQINDISISFSASGSGYYTRGYLLGSFDENAATYENTHENLKYGYETWKSENISSDEISNIDFIRAAACVPPSGGSSYGYGAYLMPHKSVIPNLILSAKPTLNASFLSNKRYLILSSAKVNGTWLTPQSSSLNLSSFAIDTTQPVLFELLTKGSSGTSLYEPSIDTVAIRYVDNTGKWKDFSTSEKLFEISGNEFYRESASTVSFVVNSTGGGIHGPVYLKLQATPKPFLSFSPSSNVFVNRREDYTFNFLPNAGVLGKTFKYRLSTSTEYTTIALSGATSYTLPANTITTGAEFTYFWTALDRYGETYDSDPLTFSTLDAQASSIPVSPVGGIEDIDNPVAFIWQHSTATGSPQTKADLQISADGAEWTELATVEGAETMYTLPAKGLAVGTWYWRVRTYNLDGIAGEWSAAAQFLAVGSPPTPVLNIVDASPRPTIAWQVTDQEAWELTIDGATATNYGTGKRWTSPRYLEDGQHTVSVRVQNKYGRWSNPGSLIVEVQNVPGAAINLTVETGEGAALTWYGSYDFYLVERGGVPIARTTETEYTDLLSIGLCTYQVRGCYADSYNYGLSNLVEVDILPDVPVLIDIKSRDILRLPLSEQQHRTWAWSRSVSVNSYHVAGRALPSVDVGEYVDASLSGSVSFDDAADIRKFEDMLGRLVCLKTDGGDMAIGILTALNKSRGLFYATYNIAVTAADYEEEICLD